MKQLLLFALTLLCVGAAFGQTQKQKVAVYVRGDAEAGDKKVIGARLVSAITQDRRYTAVERTAEFLAAIKEAQDYDHSGEVDDSQIAAIGRKFGVEHVCVAEITPVRDATLAEARMISVATGVVSIAVNLMWGQITDAEDVLNIAANLADKLITANADADQMQRAGALAVQKADLAAAVPADQAADLCSQSRLGGYADWRLPAIAEFRQLKGYGVSLGGARYWVTGSRKGCMGATSSDVFSCEKAAVRCVRNSD